jgi:hypothetical protein
MVTGLFTALCIRTRITYPPTAATTQYQLPFEIRSSLVAQYQSIRYKATLARFSGPCRIKQNTLLI